MQYKVTCTKRERNLNYTGAYLPAELRYWFWLFRYGGFVSMHVVRSGE